MKMQGRRGVMTTIALTVMLAGINALPGLAQPHPGGDSASGRGRIPMPMLMGQPDPELTIVVRDIVILRALNSIDMSVDQVKQLIPLLERVVEADRRLRAEALRELRAERERLLVGTATAQKSDETQQAIAASRRQYEEEMERLKSQALSFLSAEQGEKLTKLTMAGWELARLGGGPARRGEAGTGVGPSGEAIQHVVDLLREKVRVMSATGQQK
jgi:hypothetical protein